jgi:hypothetical protein
VKPPSTDSTISTGWSELILRRVARDYFLLLDTDTDPHD